MEEADELVPTIRKVIAEEKKESKELKSQLRSIPQKQPPYHLLSANSEGNHL